MANPAYFGRLIISGSEVLQEQTYATLPGQASHRTDENVASRGELANISDGSTSVLGSTVTGGGSNHVLVRYDGTNWVVAGAAASAAGTLNAAKLAITGQAIGDLLYADTTTSFARLADAATGSVLVSGGVGAAPSWSASPALTSIKIGDGTAALPPQTWSNEATSGRYRISSNTFGESVATASVWTWNGGQVTYKSTFKLAFSIGNPELNAGDSFIYRTGVKALAIDADGAGGNLNNLILSTLNISMANSTSLGWQGRAQALSPADGTVAFFTNAGTVGAALSTTLHGDGTLSVRNKTDTGNGDFYAAAITATGSITSGGNVSVPAGNFFFWVGRGQFDSPVDGVIRASNNAGTGFSRLILGTNDATVNGVALRPNNSSGFVDVLKGDASALTGVQASVFQTGTALITATGASTPSFGTNFIGGTGGPTTAAQNGWVKMQDSTGATMWIPVWK